MTVTIKEIDALLPQTQCGECGFTGCKPYAEALAQQSASINQCPPGGVETVRALGALLGIDSGPYLHEAKASKRPPALASIRESECIGCTKCIQACPVDAIVGAPKFMHVVIASECTGCGLCVEPCPVDCIDLLPLTEPHYNKDKARIRYESREIRHLREEHERQQAYREKRRLAASHEDKKAKQDYILEALLRAKNKKSET